jgi:P27 family predicted phage terminase small subunit
VRGSKRTAAALIADEKHKRKVLKIVPPSPIGDITPPPELQGTALAVWKELAPQLRDMFVLAQMDRNALLQYCLCWQRLKKYEAELDKIGPYYINKKKRLARHPLHEAVMRENVELRQWVGELGLSATARSRMDVNKTTNVKAEKQGSTWDAL